MVRGADSSRKGGARNDTPFDCIARIGRFLAAWPSSAARFGLLPCTPGANFWSRLRRLVGREGQGLDRPQERVASRLLVRTLWCGMAGDVFFGAFDSALRRTMRARSGCAQDGRAVNLTGRRVWPCPKNMYFTAERRNYFVRPSPPGFSYSQAALRGGSARIFEKLALVVSTWLTAKGVNGSFDACVTQENPWVTQWKRLGDARVEFG